MKTRLLIAPFLIAALIGLMWLDHHLGTPYAFVGLCALAMVGCLVESASMIKTKGFEADLIALVFTGLALIFWLISSPADSLSAIALSAAFLAVIVGMSNVWNRQVDRFISLFTGTLGLFMYIVLPIACVVAIRVIPEAGAWLAYWLIAVCKLCDSGAYFTGKFLGKRKLIVHVSPNKTIEGLAGGLVVAGFTGLVCWLTMPAIDELIGLWPFLGMSVALGFISAHGDLVASAFKRGACVKDSGKLLPEFGGVLDIVDNFMLAGPAALVMLYFTLR